jgi:tetratricopeptide (TPR) repeat protein
MAADVRIIAVVASRPSPADPLPGPDRLESWKEIAAYLRRSERTVRRWEAEGLPVHRLQHDKRGSIYAYAPELDAWRDSRAALVAAQPAVDARAPATAPRRWQAAAAGLAVAVAVAGGWFLFGRRAPSTAASRHPEAVRAFRQAEYEGNAGRVQVASGIRLYQEAIRHDPSFAEAWTGLAFAHVAETFFGDRPAVETLASARRGAHRAAQLDPSLPMPRIVLAAVSHFLDWDHAGAERQLRESIARAPQVAVAHSWLSELLIDLRRFDEAAAAARSAQDAAPRWLEPITVAGNVHLFGGHPDLAVAEYERALAIEPQCGLANHFLGRARLARGDSDGAIRQLRASNGLLGEVPFAVADLGYALAVSGRQDEAERILDGMLARRAAGFYPAFAIAQLQMGLGRTGAALDWLERAADERIVGYYMPSVDPVYDPLRADARFQALLRRLKLS